MPLIQSPTKVSENDKGSEFEQIEPTRLIPPNLKNEVINGISDDYDEQTKASDESLFQHDHVKSCKSIEVCLNLNPNSVCTMLKLMYNPSFKCQHSYTSKLPVIGEKECDSVDTDGYSRKGAYFYHNQPKI